MNIGDVIDLEKKIENAVDTLHDLKPGEEKILRHLLKVRIHGSRWRLGLVLEKDTDG